MGRFDSLKVTDFTPSNYEKKNSNNLNRRNKKEPLPVVVGVETEPVEGETESVEGETEPVVESEWIKRISIRKAKEDSVINLNDPKFWNGPKWTGPMFIRANKMSDDTESYLRTVEKSNCSSFIIPYNNPEYSRDGLNWYGSWEDTFTSNQWQSMKDYEDENIWDECFRRMDSLHEERSEESNRHYENSGELDDFAWAEMEAEKYEEYCRKFDEMYRDNENTTDEYLEDEYDEYDE